jgi:MipA family protein
MISSGTLPATADVRQSDEQQGLGTTASGNESPKRYTLGAGVATMPPFLGSDDLEAEPAPLVDVQFGRFFARTGEGIGFNAVRNDIFTAGLTLNWMQGYDESDAPLGINEVDDALGARLFASARFKGAMVTLAGTRAVTETERGLLINAAFSYPFRPSNRLSITPSVGATWANEDYLVSYFGVDALESVASGLNSYLPSGSGFRDVSLRVGIGYRITDKISAVGSVGVVHLLDKAADSPMVERQTHPVGLLGLTYTFGR